MKTHLTTFIAIAAICLMNAGGAMTADAATTGIEEIIGARSSSPAQAVKVFDHETNNIYIITPDGRVTDVMGGRVR